MLNVLVMDVLTNVLRLQWVHSVTVRQGTSLKMILKLVKVCNIIDVLCDINIFGIYTRCQQIDFIYLLFVIFFLKCICF